MPANPMMEKSAFLEALRSPQPQQEDALALEAGDNLSDDLLTDMQTDEDPTTQEGDTFFLDPEMWPMGKWKKGQTVTVRAKVNSLGSKIGLTPLEVEYNNPDTEGRDSSEDDTEEDD